MITIKATGDTTLHTAGKYCEEDILVQVPEASGVDLPEIQNEGSASDLMENKELIDAKGNKVTGTFTIENELTEQNDLIEQIATLVATKATPPSIDANTLYIGTTVPTSDIGVNGDVYIVQGATA
jgi:hypothetical protein